MNKEEMELEKWGHDLTKISVPSNLDDYIQAGIERGRHAHRSRFRKGWLGTSIVAAVVIILFTFSVRLSPAFARTVSDVPGLSYLVNLINRDPSVQDAVKNNYIDKLDLSETHNHMTITLDSMIADRHRVVIFYKVESVGDHSNKKDPLMNAMLYDENGKELRVGIGYETSKSESTLQKIDIDLLNCKDSQLTNPLILKMKQQGQTWIFHIHYDVEKMKSMEKVYPLHQTVSLEGQKLTFNSVTIYPTGSAVDVTYDPTNTKQITHLDDLRLVDDQRKVFAGVKNGVSGMGSVDSNHQTLFLDSNYFTKPKSLHLELTRARAIDKTEQDVVVSLKDQKLLKAPGDHLLKLKAISNKKQNSKSIFLTFTIHRPQIDNGVDYQILDDKFHDETGKSFSIESWETDFLDQNSIGSEKQIEIPYINYKDPLTFHLIDYPSRIYGKVNLQLK